MVWGRVAVALYLAGASISMAYSLLGHGLPAIVPWIAGVASLLVARTYGALGEGMLVGGLAMLAATIAGMEGYGLGVASSLVASLASKSSGPRDVLAIAVAVSIVGFLGVYSWTIVAATGDASLYRVPVWVTVGLLAVAGAYLFHSGGGYGGLDAARAVMILLSGLARRGQLVGSLVIMGLVSAGLALGRNGLSLVLVWMVFMYSSTRWGPVRGAAVVLIVLSLLMYTAGVGRGFSVINAALGG